MHIICRGLLTVASCEENEAIKPVETPSSGLVGDATYTNSEYDKNLEEIARALAQSLNEVDVRTAVKEEALKMFDGDYDILYKNFRTTHFSDGFSFHQKLSSHINTDETKLKVNATVRMEAITSQIPKLQISIPIHIESWNVEGEAPWVIYIPENFQEGVTQQLKAFDSKGNEHWIDANKAPDFPVVVVGTSERVDEEGNLIADYGKKENDLINGRVAGYREFMYKINCTDLNALEHWSLGAPELEYYIAGSRNNQAVEIENGSYYKPSKRSDINNKWVELNRFIFTWNRPDYGDYISVKWIEIDDVGPLEGIKIKVKVAGQEVEYDFGKSARHDNGGQKTIWQGESTSQMYDTGKMAWYMRSIQ